MSDEDVPIEADDIMEEIEIGSDAEDDDERGEEAGDSASTGNSTDDSSEAEEEFIPERDDAKLVFNEHTGN